MLTWGFVVRNKIIILSLFLMNCVFGSTVIAKKDSKGSVFALTGKWTDQHGKVKKLNAFKGKPTVISMVYTSCDYSCPLITRKIKEIHRKLPKKLHKKIQFALFSFDP